MIGEHAHRLHFSEEPLGLALTWVVFAFEWLRSWRVESETVVRFQLNHPSGATIMLVSEAIIVIVLDCRA